MDRERYFPRGIKVGRDGLARYLLLILSICLTMFLSQACAEPDDDHDKRQRKESHREKDSHIEDKSVSNGNSQAGAIVYTQECGACHHAYFPGLLPARSWEKLLTNLNDHFGEQLPLSGSAAIDVRAYLLANAADNSENKRSRKIMKNIGSSTPLRISDIAYLKAKHHELSDDVFLRKSVGGFSNCVACHKGAQAGNFDDDSVVIPK